MPIRKVKTVRRKSWKRECEILDAHIARLEKQIADLKDSLLSAQADKDTAEKKVSELETRVIAQDLRNSELESENDRLSTDFNSLSREALSLETDKYLLEEEIRARRRFAGVLAIFHLNHNSVEDCYEEYCTAFALVYGSSKPIPVEFMSQAYKAAGRRIHKLLYTDGLALRRPSDNSTENREPKEIIVTEEVLEKLAEKISRNLG